MRVYVFGAGASKAEGAPTTNELLTQAIIRFPRDGRIRDVKSFLTDIFYINFDQEFFLPSFEDILNLIDTSLLDGLDISKKWEYNKLEDMRSKFVYCIAKILSETLKNSGHLHRQFVTRTFCDENRNNNNTAFINLNYDILLDNALIDLLEIRGYDMDYCIDFRNQKEYEELSQERRMNDWHRPRHGHSQYILKPHGSLNWIYCPNCQTVEITPKEKGVLRIFTDYETCENDGSNQRPIVIAPTWHKKYDNPNLTQIWLKCGQVLREANEVYFVGYSLPEADHRLRYLFKKNLYRENNQRPLIHVITRDSENLIALRHRYNSLFGPGITYYTIGFEGYVSSLGEDREP